MNMQVGHFDNMVGRRLLPRVRVQLPGIIIGVTGQTLCLIENLSQNGAGITVADMSPSPGDLATLSLQGAEASGIVVWRSSARFGLQFDKPLAEDEVKRFRAIYNQLKVVEFEQRRQRLQLFCARQVD